MYQSRIYFILAIILLAQIVASVFILDQLMMHDIQGYLHGIVNRVQEDIRYTNGTWDTQLYDADTLLPDTHPLYVVSVDGSIIERWRPLHGFLDTSDFKNLLRYQTPQTIKSTTNQTWRIYSLPIVNGGKTLGVITISYYNPSDSTIQSVDEQLQANAQKIRSTLTISNNQVTAEKLDVRTINYNYAFQVVNNFNQIIIKNNNNNSIDRIPNEIDSSYIAQELNSTKTRILKDSQTQESYMMISHPIYDENHSVAGIIFVGKSLNAKNLIIIQFILANAILSLITFALIAYVLRRVCTRTDRSEATTAQNIEANPTYISFDKTNSKLHINDDEIDIPYSTNQYYLCKILFSNPKKKWDVDEILEEFGEEINNTNWRKVYDTMIILNKKTAEQLPEKLIVFKNKSYQINPTYVPLIK